MDLGTSTIRKQHKEWAAKLAAGQQAQLPTLSPADYRAVTAAHQAYEDLVGASRARGPVPAAAGQGR